MPVSVETSFCAGPPRAKMRPLGGQRPAKRRSVGATYFPHVEHDLARHAPAHAGVGKALAQRLCQRGLRRVARAPHNVLELHQRPFLRLAHALGREQGGNLAGAAHHALRAKGGVQRGDVRDAVQQRQHTRVLAHGRRDGRDAAGQVIGLAGEDDHVVLWVDLPGQHGLDLQRGLVFGALQHQAVGGDVLRACLAHEKGHISTGLMQPAAKVAADGASAEDQDFHEIGRGSP